MLLDELRDLHSLSHKFPKPSSLSISAEGNRSSAAFNPAGPGVWCWLPLPNPRPAPVAWQDESSRGESTCSRQPAPLSRQPPEQAGREEIPACAAKTMWSQSERRAGLVSPGPFFKLCFAEENRFAPKTFPLPLLRLSCFFIHSHNSSQTGC